MSTAEVLDFSPAGCRQHVARARNQRLGIVKSDSEDVAIVIVNWNGADDTIRCLEALRPDGQAGHARIICCDNHSDDDSRERLTAWAKGIPSAADWLTLVDTGRNAGYSAGNNVGIGLALEDPGIRYVWILNNDAVPYPNTLSAYRECAQKYGELWAFGATLVDGDRIVCAGGSYYRAWTTQMAPAHHGRCVNDISDLSEPRFDYVHGASLFVRAEVFKSIGLLDERFFLFHEELALCDRLRRQGSGIGWCRNAIVQHSGGASTGSVRLVTAYHETLSALLYTRFYHPLKLPFALVFRAIGKSAALVRRREWWGFGPMFRAYRTLLFADIPDHGRLVKPKIIFPDNDQST